MTLNHKIMDNVFTLYAVIVVQTTMVIKEIFQLIRYYRTRAKLNSQLGDKSSGLKSDDKSFPYCKFACPESLGDILTLESIRSLRARILMRFDELEVAKEFGLTDFSFDSNTEAKDRTIVLKLSSNNELLILLERLKQLGISISMTSILYVNDVERLVLFLISYRGQEILPKYNGLIACSF